MANGGLIGALGGVARQAPQWEQLLQSLITERRRSEESERERLATELYRGQTLGVQRERLAQDASQFTAGQDAQNQRTAFSAATTGASRVVPLEPGMEPPPGSNLLPEFYGRRWAAIPEIPKPVAEPALTLKGKSGEWRGAPSQLGEGGTQALIDDQLGGAVPERPASVVGALTAGQQRGIEMDRATADADFLLEKGFDPAGARRQLVELHGMDSRDAGVAVMEAQRARQLRLNTQSVMEARQDEGGFDEFLRNRASGGRGAGGGPGPTGQQPQGGRSPSVPIADRIAQLKASGVDREEAKRILRAEGYPIQ